MSIFKKKPKDPSTYPLNNSLCQAWNLVPLGTTNESSVWWDVLQTPICLVKADGGAGADSFLETVIYSCRENFDIHCIDLIVCGCSYPFNKWCERYTFKEDVVSCFNKLAQNVFCKPQLLIIENFSTIDDSVVNREEFMQSLNSVLFNCRNNNVYVLIVEKKYSQEFLSTVQPLTPFRFVMTNSFSEVEEFLHVSPQGEEDQVWQKGTAYYLDPTRGVVKFKTYYIHPKKLKDILEYTTVIHHTRTLEEFQTAVLHDFKQMRPGLEIDYAEILSSFGLQILFTEWYDNYMHKASINGITKPEYRSISETAVELFNLCERIGTFDKYRQDIKNYFINELHYSEETTEAYLSSPFIQRKLPKLYQYYLEGAVSAFVPKSVAIGLDALYDLETNE